MSDPLLHLGIAPRGAAMRPTFHRLRADGIAAYLGIAGMRGGRETILRDLGTLGDTEFVMQLALLTARTPLMATLGHRRLPPRGVEQVHERAASASISLRSSGERLSGVARSIFNRVLSSA